MGDVPTFEVHLNTPFGHDQFKANSLDLTQGVHFELRRRWCFTVGITENVTNPKLFDVEAIAQLNYRY